MFDTIRVENANPPPHFVALTFKRESLVWRNSCTVGLSESNSFQSIEGVKDHKHITSLDVVADFLTIIS